MTTNNVIQDQGTCECILEPSGKGGLEGYVSGEKYRYMHMSHDKHGKPYYRVFTSDLWPDYYETCDESLFRAHFTITEKEMAK